MQDWVFRLGFGPMLIAVQQLWSGFIQESLSQASHNGHHFNEFIANCSSTTMVTLTFGPLLIKAIETGMVILTMDIPVSIYLAYSQQLWSGFIQESLSQASHNGHHFNEFIATQIDVNISISGFFVNQTTTDKHLTKEKLSHTSKKKKDLLCACLGCPFKHQTGYYACISGQKLCSLKQLHFLRLSIALLWLLHFTFRHLTKEKISNRSKKKRPPVCLPGMSIQTSNWLLCMYFWLEIVKFKAITLF